ncbi:MAG: hypothetical protein JWO59_1889, partial [Chloroflexi bacterium]|nr:hypothetical protein [Chloroflexota bacterium]
MQPQSQGKDPIRRAATRLDDRPNLALRHRTGPLGSLRLADVVFLPALIVFGIPMGLGNNSAQPLALALMLPYLFYAMRALPLILVMAVWLIIVTASSGMQSDSDTASLYQALRSGIPFGCLLAILIGYRQLSGGVSRRLNRLPIATKTLGDVVIYCFLIGQCLQIALFTAHIPLANSSLASVLTSRVFLFPISCTILIFFYACYNRRAAIAALSAAVILATGSKGMLICLIALAGLAMFNRFSLRSLGIYLATTGMLVALALYGSPVAAGRLSSFLTDERRIDGTRSYEIAHANSAWTTNGWTVV